MTSIAFETTPLNKGIGADVHDIDLGLLSESDSKDVYRALQAAVDEHLMLRFRSQTSDPAKVVAFARHFGSLMNLKRADNPDAIHVPSCPEIKVISNGRTEDGRPLGDGGNSVAQIWHTDGSHKERPPAYTIFCAQQAPANPPKTCFMSMYQAYESLPAALRDRIALLRVIHHYYPRSNEEDIFWNGSALTRNEREVGPIHPLVRVHPLSGKPALFLPQRRDAIILGLSDEEGFKLLDDLFRHVLAQTDTCAVGLEPSDIVIWDNRFSLHGREGWDPSEDRVMWHLTVEGEVPIAVRSEAALQPAIA